MTVPVRTKGCVRESPGCTELPVFSEREVWNWVWHACTSTGKVEAGGSENQGHLELYKVLGAKKIMVCGWVESVLSDLGNEVTVLFRKHVSKYLNPTFKSVAGVSVLEMYSEPQKWKRSRIDLWVFSPLVKKEALLNYFTRLQLQKARHV